MTSNEQGSLLATGGKDGIMRLWSLNNFGLIHSFECKGTFLHSAWTQNVIEPIVRVVLDVKALKLACALADMRVLVYDLGTRKQLATVVCQGSGKGSDVRLCHYVAGINSIDFLPDTDTLLVSSGSGELNLLNYSTAEFTRILDQDSQLEQEKIASESVLQPRVLSRVIPDHDLMITAAGGTTASLWQLGTLKPLERFHVCPQGN